MKNDHFYVKVHSTQNHFAPRTSSRFLERIAKVVAVVEKLLKFFFVHRKKAKKTILVMVQAGSRRVIWSMLSSDLFVSRSRHNEKQFLS